MARFCGAAQTPLPTHFLKILCCLATTVVLVSDGSAASFSPPWLSLLGPKHGSKFQVYPEPSPSKNEEYSIAILDIFHCFSSFGLMMLFSLLPFTTFYFSITASLDLSSITTVSSS
jgi:hypothetical protein